MKYVYFIFGGLVIILLLLLVAVPRKEVPKKLEKKLPEKVIVSEKSLFKEGINTTIISKNNKKTTIKYTNNESLNATINLTKPNIELSKWGGEGKVNINIENDSPLSINDSPLNVSLEYDDYDYDIRALPTDNINENGGIEFDIILKKKPKTNKFLFSIDTENLDFFYQPPLNEEYNDPSCNATDCQGSHRPINVVGSYAVYHKYKKNNQYKTGKAFHIYRPKVYDADGKWTWGKLSIINSTLIVEVDEDFLNNAKYPVRIDPTIGYTTAGASYQDANQYISGSLFAGKSGWLQDAYAYVKINIVAASAGYAMAAYYENNTLLDNATFATTSSSYTGWVSRPFVVGRFISVCNNYDLVMSGDRGIQYNSVYIYYDTGTTNQGGRQAYDVRGNGAFPDPWSPTRNNNKYSVYVTYTVSYNCDGCDIVTDCSTHGCFNITNGTDVIARFDELGSLDVKGNLTTGAVSLGNFTIKNSNGDIVASFNETGGFQLLDSYSVNMGYCTDPSEAFVIKDPSGNCVSFIDKNGTMWLRGNLCYNANI